MIETRNERPHRIGLQQTEGVPLGADPPVHDTEVGPRRRPAEARQAGEEFRAGGGVRQVVGDFGEFLGLCRQVLERLSRRALHVFQRRRLQELREQARQVELLHDSDDVRVVQHVREPRQDADHPFLEGGGVTPGPDPHDALLHLLDSRHQDGHRALREECPGEVDVLRREVGQQAGRARLLLRHPGRVQQLHQGVQLASRHAQAVRELLPHVEGEHVEELHGYDA